MRSLVYWKPLMVSEHRNSMTTMSSRAGRIPVYTGGVRRPARTLCSSSRQKILATESAFRDLVTYRDKMGWSGKCWALQL